LDVKRRLIISIKVLLVDDHKMILDGLKSLINKHENIVVIGEAGNGAEAIELAKELKPDIVIMDISMPDMNGIEATRRLKASMKNIKIIALSMHNNKKFVSEMLRAGADGYVVKHSAYEELISAIDTVNIKKRFLSPCLLDCVLDNCVAGYSLRGENVYTKLSQTERQVLQILTEGKCSKEIASRLNISVRTVDTHRHNIMKKLSLHSVAELTKYAVREGITALEQ
jgi:DNA-binding NarL/FixJ family response regulator